MTSVQRLETWAAKYVQTFPLSILEGSVIGVDASYYLDQCLNENKEEPLKSALGGTPFCLKSRIEDDLHVVKEAGFSLLFVFNGLDFVNQSPPNSESLESKKAYEEGWSHYLAGDAASPVQDFGRAKYPTDLVGRYVRKILYHNNVPYLVAPFSAVAQLALLYHTGNGQPIDAVMASTDAFLFDVDKVILALDSKDQTFGWLRRSDCEEPLGRPPTQAFKDAQLMLGSTFLPPFPILERSPANASPSIRDALAMLNRSGGSVLQLCHQHRDDPSVQNLDYADRYRKAVMTIKHHVVLTPEGSVVPLDFEHAPGDVHAFVGQRLPDELIFYISRGLLGPQVPSWLMTGEINLTLPGGVVDSDPYKRVVVEQLNPLRLQALKLLAESLHFYYQGRDLSWKIWDGRDTKGMSTKVKDVTPLKEKANQWKVKSSSIPHDDTGRLPTLHACLHALRNSSFAQSSITKGRVEHPALKTQHEIVANVYWRFLQIRGYVDDKHQLTSHGQMLEAALSRLEGGSNQEELVLLAIELLRLGLLNTHSLTATAAPLQNKSGKHDAYVNLVSKIACLGRLKHEPVGYVGPLDRQLLTFAWIVSTLRSLLRDLMETVLVTMFLNGDVSRERGDWYEIPQRLPLISDNGSSLGIATKTYLDALGENGISDDIKESIKGQKDKYNWFAQVKGGTLHKNLDNAFRLFDAVVAATRAIPDAKDAKTFADVERWLAPRR